MGEWTKGSEDTWAGLPATPKQIFVSMKRSMKEAGHKQWQLKVCVLKRRCQVCGAEEMGGLGTEVQLNDMAEWGLEHRCPGAWR